MQWFEPLIAVGAVLLVVLPIASHFIKKKKGTLKCECGHLRSECVSDCTKCSINTKEIIDNCKRDLENEGI